MNPFLAEYDWYQTYLKVKEAVDSARGQVDICTCEYDDAGHVTRDPDCFYYQSVEDNNRKRADIVIATMEGR